MSRITRARQVVKTETESRATEKAPKASAAKVSKKKDKLKTKVNNVLDQNENAVPSGRNQKVLNKRNAKAEVLSDLRTSATTEDVPAMEKCTHFGLKSPVLRDRTNKSDKPTECLLSPKKSVQPESKKEQIKPVLLNQDKKFFKFKNEGVVTGQGTIPKKTTDYLNKKKRAPVKKRAPSDSTFSPITDDQRVSSKPPEKSLRPRAAKNYCELSKLSHSSDGDKCSAEKDKLIADDQKDVPIYKTIKLSQEKVGDKEEIYEFPDDSQEKDPSKKKKRTTKKPRVKRAKKTESVPKTMIKKSVTRIPKINTSIAHPNERKHTDIPKENSIKQTNQNLIIPENFVDAGHDTFEEAPTIRIVSDQKLTGEKKLNLSTTLSNQKTLTSGYKLDASKDSVRSPQSTIADNAVNDSCPNDDLNMVNHSLIRKSMSPITKLVEKFDARSPWRPMGNFSCVKQLVQSTPQINKTSSMATKKLYHNEAQNGRRQSISSEDTIQASIPNQNQTPMSPLNTKNEDSTMNVGASSVKCHSPNLRQTNLDCFLNQVEKPETTRISTAHGIFDDVSSTPINGKKQRRMSEEANVENAFGFDDCDMSDIAALKKHSSIPKIATEKDVKESKKGKVFVNARIKSSVPSRISTNTVKRTLLRDVQKRNMKQNVVTDKIFEEKDLSESVIQTFEQEQLDNTENDANLQNNDYDHRFADAKKAVIDSISFSDTFDLLSEKEEELQSKVPEEVPLFVDLEPVHFSQPPRRSYNKRKRAVCFESISKNIENDDDEDDEPRKPKKKKESKHVKEEKKQLQEWVKTMNKTFEEVENFDLVVE